MFGDVNEPLVSVSLQTLSVLLDYKSFETEAYSNSSNGEPSTSTPLEHDNVTSSLVRYLKYFEFYCIKIRQ